MRFRMPLLFLALLMLCCCQADSGKHRHEHSFYQWKLNAANQSAGASYSKMRSVGVEHLYIHYMDIDWSAREQMPVPSAILNTIPFTNPLLQNHTPVVFITNRVFEHIPDSWCDTLVEKLIVKLDEISGAIQTKTAFSKLPEIQIDCDWTAKTKDRYFLFLQKLKKALPGKTISVTIRMYPYKYPEKVGVPPVDRGVLMCYNLGSIQDIRTRNSIFDLVEFKKYLRKDAYPLPLDIVLPAFGWHAWFQGMQFKGIIYNLPGDMQASVFKRLQPNQYQLLRDTVIQGQYLREGDLLRAECPDAAMLMQAAGIITQQVPGYRRMIFYHWDEANVQQYEKLINEVFQQY